MLQRPRLLLRDDRLPMRRNRLRRLNQAHLAWSARTRMRTVPTRLSLAVGIALIARTTRSGIVAARQAVPPAPLASAPGQSARYGSNCTTLRSRQARRRFAPPSDRSRSDTA